MGLPTFNLEVNNKPNQKGLYVVFIRITQDRKKHRVKTSIALRRLSDWNKKKQRVRETESKSKAWNLALDRELERARETYRNLAYEGQASSTNIVKSLKNEDEKPTLLAYSKKIREEMLTEGHLGNWQKYGTFINQMEAYLTRRGKLVDVPFKEVNYEFVEGYTAYLNTLENQRTKGRLHPNTISKHQRIFRAILNRAVNAGYLKFDENPFRSYKIKEIKVVKERLERQDMDALASLDLQPNSPKWHARNAFFFSYYCAGIRAGDMMQLRWKDVSGGRLSYQMGKNHKGRDILLVDQARDILDLYRKEKQKPTDYIFPYLNSRASYARAVTQEEKDTMPVVLKQELFADIHRRNIQINRRLQGLMEMAGISKHISFHMARHTFARQAKQAGTDNAVLKDMLAHSSLNVTERYMGEFDTEAQDQALEKIFSTTDRHKPKDLSKETLVSLLKDLDKETLLEVLSSISQTS